MAELRIGTSGYTYGHWRGVFYPQDLPYRDFLKWYAQHFDTVEINSSFYHLPREKTYENWYSLTPKNFLFALKASRFITHIKKLKNCQEPLEIFLERAKILKEKLGPILFQFPPSWKLNLERLEEFLKLIPKGLQTTVEFRHESWFTNEVYQTLGKFNAALTFADTPSYPLVETVTADFVYLRFHGHKELYASNYSEGKLKSWARKIHKWGKTVKKVYAYFDNDAWGFAVNNATRLKILLS